jgi:6-phosphofructokinase 1
MVGYWNQRFIHVPIAAATTHRRQLDPQGPVWQRVLEIAGQPALRPA